MPVPCRHSTKAKRWRTCGEGVIFLGVWGYHSDQRTQDFQNHLKGAQTPRSRLVPSDRRGMEANLVAMEDVWGTGAKNHGRSRSEQIGSIEELKRTVWILSLLCYRLEQNLCHALAPLAGNAWRWREACWGHEWSQPVDEVDPDHPVIQKRREFKSCLQMRFE